MSSDDEKLVSWISSCEDIKKLQSFAANVEAKGRIDLRDLALSRSWRLAGAIETSELARDFFAMLAAYEHYLFQKHGKRVQAAYIRRALKEKGIKATLEDWALNPKETPGFLSLLQAKLPEFTGECVVIRHAEAFPEHVVAAAKARLDKFGVTDYGRPR